MPKYDARFTLLTAQLRAYGGRVSRNVIDGYNVTYGKDVRLGFTHDWSGAPARNYPALISALRAALDRARNPRGRFYTLTPDPDGHLGKGWVGIVDSLADDTVVAWTTEDRVAAVIAGLADAEVTRD